MAWRSVPFGEFLTRSDDWIEPQPDQIYKQITARLWGRGLRLRGEVYGSQIAARRQVQVREDQFLLSRIDARHGASGLVPAELDRALVSGDFPAFDVDGSRTHPRYLEWYSKTNGFVDLCRRASEGSTNRVRLKEEKFLAMEMPLPPFEEQRRLVARLDCVAGLVKERRKVLAAADRDSDLLLRKAFDRATEGVGYLPMEQVAPLVRRPIDIQPDESYPELGVRSFGRGTFHKPALDGTAVGTKKLYRIAARDLVFNIVFAWEGAVAIARDEDEGRVGSHRFLTCVPEPGGPSVEFLLYYFLSREGLRRLGEASPGGAGRNRTLGPEEARGDHGAGTVAREAALVRPPPGEGTSITQGPRRDLRRIGRAHPGHAARGVRQ